MSPKPSFSSKLIYISLALVLAPILFWITLSLTDPIVTWIGFLLIVTAPWVKLVGIILGFAIISASIIPSEYLLSKVFPVLRNLFKIHIVILVLILLFSGALRGYSYFAFKSEQKALEKKAEEQNLIYKPTYLPLNIKEMATNYNVFGAQIFSRYGFSSDDEVLYFQIRTLRNPPDEYCILSNNIPPCKGSVSEDWEGLSLNDGSQSFFRKGVYPKLLVLPRKEVGYVFELTLSSGYDHIYQSDPDQFERRYFNVREEFIKIANSITQIK